MQRRWVRLVGRGASALYVALRALALLRGPSDVLLPDLLCSTVVDAVLLAGFRPVFADVLADVETGRCQVDLQAVQRVLAAQPATAVVMAHVYGYVHGPLALPASAVLIEDAVQGLEARCVEVMCVAWLGCV
jgi:dTDP-4-amino-4,6-dideoxygalactose transaminase